MEKFKMNRHRYTGRRRRHNGTLVPAGAGALHIRPFIVQNLFTNSKSGLLCGHERMQEWGGGLRGWEIQDQGEWETVTGDLARLRERVEK